MAPIGTSWATGSWNDNAWAIGTWGAYVINDIGRVVRMWMKHNRRMIKKGI